ncbi:hypothetical protein [Inconstantimicrobium mannanitabidum]|uniref:Uncharacterized protein n=1 Tax=Inconstantimicrobium mannanitabidum TaxID=1604901 RepID=A0ACB5R7K3_9CLOT|nr:hypothetical protein [Clostridium sp. TW13]GKX65168.1 hypothetical protein rsdtw13_04260 [Clostridium sp. TW13]
MNKGKIKAIITIFMAVAVFSGCSASKSVDKQTGASAQKESTSTKDKTNSTDSTANILAATSSTDLIKTYYDEMRKKVKADTTISGIRASILKGTDGDKIFLKFDELAKKDYGLNQVEGNISNIIDRTSFTNTSDVKEMPNKIDSMERVVLGIDSLLLDMKLTKIDMCNGVKNSVIQILADKFKLELDYNETYAFIELDDVEPSKLDKYEKYLTQIIYAFCEESKLDTNELDNKYSELKNNIGKDKKSIEVLLPNKMKVTLDLENGTTPGNVKIVMSAYYNR